MTGPTLNAYNALPELFGDSITSGTQPAECVLVIDSGFSHTTITPVYRGRAIQQANRRIDIGGKFLTNYLKELVSIRHYNMQDESHVMNDVKEAVSFVSQDFASDLVQTWKSSTSKQRAQAATSILAANPAHSENGGLLDYVLPDYNARRQGFSRPHDPSATARLRKLGTMAGAGDAAEEVMTLGNERFAVPELLFSPLDIGMRQTGIPEAVMQSLSLVPTGLWACMLANILVVGGSSLIPGFMSRM